MYNISWHSVSCYFSLDQKDRLTFLSLAQGLKKHRYPKISQWCELSQRACGLPTHSPSSQSCLRQEKAVGDVLIILLLHALRSHWLVQRLRLNSFKECWNLSVNRLPFVSQQRFYSPLQPTCPTQSFIRTCLPTQKKQAQTKNNNTHSNTHTLTVWVPMSSEKIRHTWQKDHSDGRLGVERLGKRRGHEMEIKMAEWIETDTREDGRVALTPVCKVGW